MMASPVRRVALAALLTSGVSAVCQKAGDVARFFAFGSSWTANSFALAPNTSTCQANAWPSCTGTLPKSLFGSGLTTDSNEASGNNTNGYNYLIYLAEQSSILTYDLAVGGSGVNQQVLAVANPYDFKTQVSEFGKFFNTSRSCTSAETIPMSSTDTIFWIFVGDNDILDGAIQSGDVSNNMTTFNTIVADYQKYVADLYYAGARQFVYIGTPAQEYSELVTSPSAPTTQDYLSWKWKYDSTISNWWSSVNNSESFPDLNVYAYNMSAFMDGLLANPNQPQYQITSDLDLVNGKASGFTVPYYLQNCTGTSRPCVWSNSFHATYQVHGLMAKDMYAGLHQAFNFGAAPANTTSPNASATYTNPNASVTSMSVSTQTKSSSANSLQGSLQALGVISSCCCLLSAALFLAIS